MHVQIERRMCYFKVITACMYRAVATGTVGLVSIEPLFEATTTFLIIMTNSDILCGACRGGTEQLL